MINAVADSGANEPVAETAAQWDTLLAYHQTFVDAVHATGGNNSSRWLVIQGPRTDIDLTDQLASSLPSDSASGRLAFEVHYYSPFSFTLQSQDEDWGKMFYFWGEGYHHATRTDRNASFRDEAYLDAQFQKMADKFVGQGIPVIIGEFAAMNRTGQSDLTGADLDPHLASRTYYHRYVVNSANSKGLKPIHWLRLRFLKQGSARSKGGIDGNALLQKVAASGPIRRMVPSQPIFLRRNIAE